MDAAAFEQVYGAFKDVTLNQSYRASACFITSGRTGESLRLPAVTTWARGNAVGGVGDHVDFEAEEVLRAAFLGLGRVLDAPLGVRVAHVLAVGVGVGAYGGGLDRHLVAQARQPLLEAVGNIRQDCFHQASMMGEALDEAVEGGAVWDVVAKAAQVPQAGLIPQQPD